MKTWNGLFIGLLLSISCFYVQAGMPSSSILEGGIDVYEMDVDNVLTFKPDSLRVNEFTETDEEEIAENHPFDTHAIYLDYVLLRGVVLEPEKEFDDIPFDTFDVYCTYLSLDTGNRVKNIDKYILACMCKKISGINLKMCKELEKQIQFSTQIALR
ncbi:MAG: hypothetical protein JEZ03_02370 [Bacteroidales bacterium]|nr:hypothetical protein [Bacteroidales bacterium]